MPPAEKDLPLATVKQGDNVEVKAANANSGAPGEQLAEAQQQHCEAISMQFTTFLALEAMHLSYAANCLLPNSNEPHDMKLSFVRIQTRAASRRACGI